MAPSSTVHMLLPVDGVGHRPERAIGLYWPDTGALALYGLPESPGPLLVACSVRRCPVDGHGHAVLGPNLSPGALVALTAAGETRALLALLEVVPIVPSGARSVAPSRAAG